MTSKPAGRHTAPLKDDTLYYRHDHPDGFVFSAGNPPPDPEHGWVKSPADIGPAPARTYECTSFDAYEAVLAGERASAAAANAQLIQLSGRVRALTALVQDQNQVIATQTAQIAKHQAEEG